MPTKGHPLWHAAREADDALSAALKKAGTHRWTDAKHWPEDVKRAYEAKKAADEAWLPIAREMLVTVAVATIGRGDRPLDGMANAPTDPTVSNTILRQLGGQRLLAMTGARDLVYDNRSLTVRLPKAKDGIRYVKVTLTDADLYELQGFDKTGAPMKPAILDDVDCEQLRPAFEAMTSLRVSL